jgi:hypothetical protein
LPGVERITSEFVEHGAISRLELSRPALIRKRALDVSALGGDQPARQDRQATKVYVEWHYVNQSVGPAEQHLDHAHVCAEKALARDPDCYLGPRPVLDIRLQPGLQKHKRRTEHQFLAPFVVNEG